jgi:hypothetical protein
MYFAGLKFLESLFFFEATIGCANLFCEIFEAKLSPRSSLFCEFKRRTCVCVCVCGMLLWSPRCSDDGIFFRSSRCSGGEALCWHVRVVRT